MYQTSQHSAHGFQLQFTKGMTLQQFMAGLTFTNPEITAQTEGNEEQNLFESSFSASLEKCLNQNRAAPMQDIEQESEDQVKNSLQTDFKDSTEPDTKKCQQLTKATFRQAHDEAFQKRNSVQITSKMNSTAYFGSSSIDKGFRIKNVSNSPAKKTKESSMPSNSMTLYGVKFNNSKQKQASKMTELITFYGKARHETKEDKKEERRPSLKNMKKKNTAELHCLFQLENKTKNRLVNNKICLPDIQIEGLRDKIIQRKNKFC